MWKFLICTSITAIQNNSDNYHKAHINICLKSDALLIPNVLIYLYNSFNSFCYPLHEFIIKQDSERGCCQTGRVCLQSCIDSTHGWGSKLPTSEKQGQDSQSLVLKSSWDDQWCKQSSQQWAAPGASLCW